MAVLRIVSVLVVTCAAACTDPGDPEPLVQPPSIQLLPDPFPHLSLGSTFQVQAVVTGSESQVAWATSNPAVVRVDNQGKINAVANGSSFVIGWLLFDPAIRDSTFVQVGGGVLIPPPTINISSITDTLGVPIDTAAVRGTVKVTFTSDIPPLFLNEVEISLRLRDAEVCNVRLTSNPMTHICLIDTTRFGNGTATLRAFLLRTNDRTILANTRSYALTLTN